MNIIYTHEPTGITGTIDDRTEHPDGKRFVRIDDHWLDATEIHLNVPWYVWYVAGVVISVSLTVVGLWLL